MKHMPARRFALLGVLGLALTGCEPGALSEPPQAACRETGALCQLGGGPLGVCERVSCAAGEEAPCFRCTPQH